jgi:hypothetical protein
MEDEGFVDDDFIEDAAWEWVGRHGSNSLALLRERAAIAEAAGDFLLAETWCSILDVAQRVIGFDPIPDRPSR